MTTILTDCASKIVEKLMNLLIAETRYVCCFKCIVEDFEKEKEELNAKWITVKKDVEDAKGRADNIRDDVTYWQGEAENLIKEDTKTKMSCFFGWCPNCIWRYHRSKELSLKTEDIRRLKGKNFEIVGRPSHLPGVEYHSSQGYIHFESRDLKYKELLDALEDDNNYMTGFQGMGGSGKTTMAIEVGKKLKESKKFDHVIFTVVSNSPDMKKIQDSIAGPLGLSLKDKSEWECSKLLWNRLTDGQKILIILDDVWELINFEEIGIPLSDNHKGCRVLLTTRNVRVCILMGCQKTIQLGLLTEKDAWILFKKRSGISDDSSKNLQDKGQEIVKECKGLPVAIAAIARTLKGQQHLEEWNAALTALQISMPMHGVDESLIGTYKCLRYSYDYMKSEKDKGLFLLCSVFQEDEEISSEILTRFAVGVGLLGEVEKYDVARNQVHVAKNRLIDSCLLLEAEEACVKMHDLVREVALWIANNEIQVVALSDKKQKALAEKEKNMKYLLCDGKDMDVFSSWFDGTKLEILVVHIDADDCVNVQSAFFEKMTRLRVLHLYYKGWPREVLSLPQSIQSLMNIRSVFLEDWKLGDISILGTLRTLETLDLVDCSINELPNQITELEKLRLLKLYDCEIERNNPFEVIERCLSLEELYFEKNEISPLVSVNEVEIVNHNRIFPALQRYRLSGNWDTYDTISKCVALKNIDALTSEATFKYLARKAEILELEEIKGEWRNLIPEIVPMETEGMNDLVKLCLDSCSKVKCLIDTRHISSRVRNVFSKLVKLKLVCMDNLEELCSGSVPFDFLKSLEKLRISDCEHLGSILFKSKLNLCYLKIMKLEECPMLTSIFQWPTARSLVLLEKLRICGCEQLTRIITDERSGGKNSEEIVDSDNDRKSCDAMFPKLNTLEIKRCDRLEFILPILFAQDVPLLEVIKIDDCGELKYIFGQYQNEDKELHQEAKDVVLGSLKEIVLNRLPNFIDIFPECYHPTSSFVKRSSLRESFKAKQSDPSKHNIFPWSHICCFAHKYRPKLRSATSTKDRMIPKDGLPDYSIASGLQTLNSECLLPPLESAQCISKLSLILRNIRKVELKDLPKMKFLFILSIAPTMLVEILRIENCHGLKHIITDIKDGCDGNNWRVVFPKLKELYVYDCEQLKYIFGEYPHDLQNYNEICIHLASLEKFTLRNLPNVFSIFPKSYRTTWPSLKEFRLIGCPQFSVTSISDFMVDLDSRQLGHATKGLRTSSSECVNLFDTAQSLLRQSLILHNIKDMALVNCPKVISLFTFSVASTMLVEILKIEECHGVKHIIADMGHDQGRKNCGPIFPKLKVLSISECDQLEYIFGQYNTNEDQNHNLKFHVDLLALEELTLRNLPDIINICPRNCSVTTPSLKVFNLNECPQFAIKSINDFMGFLDSRQPDGTTTKELGGIVKHLVTLENLYIKISKVESVFCLNGLQNGQQMNLGLQYLKLDNLPHMMYICVGPKNYFTFQHLRELKIVGCEKLAVIFPASISRWLPQLATIEIKDCKELKQIIEEDMENQKLSNLLSPQPCFPELTALLVEQCNELKRFIPISVSNELPKLELLIIKEASKLEEVFGCDKTGELKVDLPKLKLIIFMQLPSLCRGFELQTVRHRVVRTCPKLSVSSTAHTGQELLNNLMDSREYKIGGFFLHRIRNMIDEMMGSNLQFQNPTAETASEFRVGPEDEAASGSEFPSSQVNVNQSLQANPAEYGQNDNDIQSVMTKTKQTPDPKSSPIALPILKESNEEPEKEFVGKGPGSELTAIATSTADLELVGRTSPRPLDPPLHKTHSHELVDEQSTGEPCLMNQKQPIGETEITTQSRQGNNCPKEIEDQSIQEGSKSEKIVTATLSTGTDSETRNTSSGPLLASMQKSVKRSVEEEITSEGNKIVTSQRKTYPHSNEEPEKEFVRKVPISEIPAIATSSTDSELIGRPSPSPMDIPLHKTHSHELVDGQSIGEPCFMNQQQPIGETQISIEILQGNNSVNRNVEEGSIPENAKIVNSSTLSEPACSPSGPLVTSKRKSYPNEDDDGQIHVRVSQEASELVVTPTETQAPENPPQMEKDSSFACHVTEELEHLVSSKHLDSGNLSLLNDFLLKHPSVRLKDGALSNRYRGCAYNCLADLLKFLQTYSALEVAGSRRSDFVELLRDVRSFAFDKEWFDAVERRATFLGLEVSQEVLLKLLDSKHQATLEVQALRSNIGFLTQHVEALKEQLASSEAVLERITQQEAKILEARAALSTPLGF